MAWDIYGNNLREGFCEVHPYVNEYYPCRICCDEIQKEEDRRREHDQQKADYEKAMEQECYKAMELNQIEKLEADKAELLEALENLKEYGKPICNDAGDGIIIDYETMAEIESLIQKHNQ